MKPKLGIYNAYLPECGGGGAEKRTLVMAEHLSRRFDVTLVTGSHFSAERNERYFSVDLSRVRILRLPDLLPFSRDRRWADLPERLLENRHSSRLRALGLDVFINNHYSSNLPCPSPHGIYMCMFPHDLRGAVKGRGVLASAHSHLLGMPPATRNSYEIISANSLFTASWVRRYWAREASVVYSVGEPMGPAREKRRSILHVGRFVEPSRADNKHQQTLLEVFRGMRDLHAAGWELHLAGSLLTDPGAQRLARELRRDAAGLPVHFHFNAPFAELRDLYRDSAIYWHATGFGSEPELDPHRQEHFGITTVEAMSAGAVPVVIRRGGQPEIVRQGESGFVWDGLDELAACTRQLAEDETLRQRLGLAAIARAENFSRAAFLQRIEALVEACLANNGNRAHV